jgi:hypothetical protein
MSDALESKGKQRVPPPGRLTLGEGGLFTEVARV